MNFELLMTSLAAGLFLIVCGLVVFIFTGLKKKVESFITSFESFREMLDKKLTHLGHALALIDKDLRGEMVSIDKGLREQIYALDRRTSHLEDGKPSRRSGD